MVGTWVRRRMLVVVGVLALVAVAAVVPRWNEIVDEVQARLDAPDVLAANRAALELELPPDFEGGGAFAVGEASLRSAWTDLAPEAAVDALAAALRGAGVPVGDTTCGAEPRPGPRLSVACTARATVRGADLMVLAANRTGVGDVPLGRTAIWVTWDNVTMSDALMDRVAAEASPHTPARGLTEEEILAALPPRYSGALATCTGLRDPCYRWEGTADAGDLPADGAVAALVRELTDRGFVVTSADPSGADPIEAYLWEYEGEHVLISLTAQRAGDGLITMVVTL